MPQVDISTVSRIPFFSKLPQHDLTAILSITQVRNIEKDSNIFSELDPPDGLYIILSGNFEIYVLSGIKGGKAKSLAKIGKGQYVGEYGLIDGEPRSASVKAITPGEVLFLPSQGFDFLLDTQPSILVGIINYLCDVINKAPNFRINSPKAELIKTKNLKNSTHNMQVLASIMREYTKLMSVK